MTLAIVGIRGLPNNYGGFETLADYLVEYLNKDFDITVFCSSKDMPTKAENYKGAKLKYIPITSHGGKGILYDSIALCRAVVSYDKILLLGFGGGFIMPFIKMFQKKIVVNIGGLDWKRDKWSLFAQKVIKKAESQLLKKIDKIVADNVGIKEYIKNEYGKDSVFISYGGDQAMKVEIDQAATKEYPFMKKKYAFIVTRIQSDNNIQMILDAFIGQNKMPLVMVGNWDNSDYGKEIKEKYIGKDNLILLDAIYDRNKLDMLRSNCYIYIHGHSAGGTNLSLVEAMYLQLPILAFASGYNEFSTEKKAVYFSNAKELRNLIDNIETLNLSLMASELKKVADNNNKWASVADKYREFILK